MPSALPGASETQVVANDLYQRCLNHGNLGSTAADTEANCRCAADYAAPFMVPTAKQAMLSGEDWKFGGFAFQGDEAVFGTQVLAKCPAIKTAFQ
jgi:hypothetical protein